MLLYVPMYRSSCLYTFQPSEANSHFQPTHACTNILKEIEYGFYPEHLKVHSKIIFYLLQDGIRKFDKYIPGLEVRICLKALRPQDPQP